MTPKERVLAALNLEIPDRVPVMPSIDGYHAPKVSGKKLGECFKDGKKMATALIAALKYYGYDGTVAEMGLGKDPTRQLGCKVRIQEDDVPIFIDNLINDIADLEKLEISDPFSEEKMVPVETVLEEIGDEYFVMGSVRAPFEYAIIVRGYVNAMGDIYENPTLLKEIIKITTNISLEVGKGLIETGVHGVIVRDSIASSSVISPQHYDEFAHPYESRVIKKLGKKTRIILHICKNSSPILEKMADTGAKALEIDSPMDIAEAKKRVGSRVCLKGNIDAVEVLQKGCVEDVKDASIKCIEGASKGGGFILSTGDTVPRDTPKENIKVMVEVAKKYGVYK